MKKAGFTLIELIISVSIIALVVGIFLANYYGGESQSQLINATSALMRELRTAQTKDAANVPYGSEASLGWGVNIVASSSEYVLFADLDGDHIYDDETEGFTVKGGRRITLPTGVVISAIDLADTINITFYHDHEVLKTYFTDGSTSFTTPVEITLTETGSGATKHVYVNPFGLIYSDL